MYSNNIALIRTTINDCLAQANSLYQDWCNDTSIRQSLIECQKDLHQADCVLTVAGFNAIAKLISEMKSSIDHLLEEGNAANIITPLLFKKLSLTIQRYLDSVAESGEDTQRSLLLYPVYRELMLERGEINFHESDLFLPVINYRDFRIVAGEITQTSVAEFNHLRKQFQQGLLQLLKDKQQTQTMALDQMNSIIAIILDKQSRPDALLFWTACQIFILLIQQNKIDYNDRTRRLFARIDQQFNHLTKGSDSISERLLQEILYFIVHADSTEPEIVNFIYAIGLNEMTNASHLNISNDYDENNHQYVRDIIGALQITWECFATGDSDAITKFSRQLDHLQETINKIDDKNLNTLLREINSTTVLLESAPEELTSTLAMEMATALLLLELVAQDFKRLNADFKQHIIAMSRRLSFALTGDVSMSGAPELPGREIILSIQQQHLKQELADTLIQNMHQVEQAMDDFFRAPDVGYDFFKSYDRLNEVAALLTSLDEIDASKAIQNLKQMIKGFNAESEQSAHHRAIDLFCAIEFYLTIMGQAHIQFNDVLLKTGFESSEIVGAINNTSEEITIVHTTVERELSQELAKTRELFDSWQGKDNKRLRKKELKENLETIKLDAAITGDEQLESISDEALDALKASSSKDINPALEQSISIIAPDLSEPSGEYETVTVGQDELDREMLEIFLEEAEIVLVNISDSLITLSNENQNLEAVTEIRRGFHTLKGSSRMVGLNRFGDMAWQIEDLLNKILTSFEQASADLILLIQEAHTLFSRWHEQLLQGQDNVDIGPLQELLEQFNHGEPLTVLSETVMKTISTCIPTPVASEISGTQTDPVEIKVQIGDISISRALYEIFMDETRKILDVLTQQYQKLRKSSKHQPEPDFLWATHTLAGISGTVRVMAIHEIAHEYELLVKYLFDSPEPLSTEHFIVLDDINQALTEMVDMVAEQQKPQQRNDLIEQLISIRQTLGQNKDKEPASGEDIEIDSVQSSISMNEKKISSDSISDTDDITSGNEITIELPSEEISLSSNSNVSQNSDSNANSVGISQTVFTSNSERRKKRLDDDIDPELLEVFLDEAQELIPQIGKDLRDWRDQPEDNTVSHSLKRLLHTMKGSARMAGAMVLGELVHHMETRVENASNLKTIPTEWFETLESSYDRIGILLDRLRETGQEKTIIMATTTTDTVFDEEGSEASLSGTNSITTLRKNIVEETLEPDNSGIIQTNEEIQVLPKKQQPKHHVKLKVHSDVADRLVNQAGQVNIIRTRAEDYLHTMKESLDTLTENISRMRGQVREIEIQAETQIKTKLSVSNEEQASFDPLEFDRFTRLQELTRFLTENVNDVTDIQQSLARDIDQTFNVLGNQSRLGRELQQELMGVRMTPFSSITERLYRIARLNSKEIGKRINLDIQGTHVELDRVILDRITAPLEHLLRNAIAHGLEHSEERIQSGKTAVGEVKLGLRKEGNEVVITLQDDGAGLNLNHILKTAVSKGIVKRKNKLSDQQICDLIFIPGFSTAEKVTQLAGRGVGLDVVRDEINGLGGRIEVHSEFGHGTEFIIYLPLNLNVTQVVMVQVGQQLFAIPSTMFVQIQLYSAEGIAELDETGQLNRQGEDYPYHYLPHLLGYTNAKPEIKRSNPVLLLRSGNNHIAILVDGLSGNREITIKRLSGHMAYIPGITGATVLGNGEVTMILNPVQLASNQLANPITDKITKSDIQIATENKTPTVMVVDDSLTVRKITGRLLKRAGYNVITAKDGIEALEILNQTIPNAMLVDVEMPRMDGFDLVRQVRGTSEYAALPIIMITSRTADKHRQIAREIGVDRFLGKPYQDDDVLKHLDQLLRLEKSQSNGNNIIDFIDLEENDKPGKEY